MINKTSEKTWPKHRILIVDDRNTTRNILQTLVENSGYAATSVSSGEEALYYLEKMPFSLILLDIVMPEISGIELLKIIRQKYSMSELPVLMITAIEKSEDIQNAFSLGANDYIIKPIDFPTVCARMDAHIKHKEINDDIKSSLSEMEKDIKDERIKISSSNKVIKLEKARRQKIERTLKESKVYFHNLATFNCLRSNETFEGKKFFFFY